MMYIKLWVPVLSLAFLAAGCGGSDDAPANDTSKEAAPSAKTSSPSRVPLHLTQQEIAARIGTVHELVSRNLGRLQAEGIMRLEGHTLIVHDLKRLEEEAQDGE